MKIVIFVAKSFVSFYPPHISEKFTSPKNAGKVDGANAFGTSASFVCGAFVRISLRIEGKLISDAKFQTNGCGYMAAAAEVVIGQLLGRRLTELRGLAHDELNAQAAGELEEFPDSRKQCSELVGEALRDALSDYRARVLEEFQGEKALICTCFGVSEETILSVIALNKPIDVGDVSDMCNAGRGCGSCQMMIQEMIDADRSGFG